MPGINALLLGSLLYRSRLVPRIIPVMGLIGGPLLIMTWHDERRLGSTLVRTRLAEQSYGLIGHPCREMDLIGRLTCSRR